MEIPDARVAGDVAVREWGEENAKPLVFWHALGDHNNLQLIEVGPILARDYGLRCIAIDAPGFGASPKPPDGDRAYELPRLVEMAIRALDALGLDRAAWMGASWGASIGVHVGASQPERLSGLVLLDGGYRDLQLERTLEEEKAHWRSQPHLFNFADWDTMLEDAKQYFPRWNDAIATMNRASFREEDGTVASIMGPDAYAAAAYGIAEAPVSAVHERLGASGLPVLLLAATLPPELLEERRRHVTEFQRRVPQADVRWLGETSHFVLEDDPEQAARIVGEWVSAYA